MGGVDFACFSYGLNHQIRQPLSSEEDPDQLEKHLLLQRDTRTSILRLPRASVAFRKWFFRCEDVDLNSGKEVLLRGTSLRRRNELHRAVENGDLNSVDGLVLNRRQLCFQKDRNGRTPLHVAVQKGRIDVINLLLLYCPESVKEVTSVTRETCLHTAVIHNKTKVVHCLLNWIGERPEFFHVLNLGDSEGNTALHLSASRKQLQTLRLLLGSKLVDVNALNSSGCTALDILYVLPYSSRIDKQIDCMLGQAGAMRARDFINKQRSGCHCCHRSPRASSNSVLSSKSVLLVTVTLLATISYQVALNLRAGGASNLRKGYMYNYVTSTVQMNKHVSAISGSILLFSSISFLTSLSMIVYLLREFPLKPWPQISVSSLFGSYMCSVMAVSPSEARALLFLSVPLLVLAATR